MMVNSVYEICIEQPEIKLRAGHSINLTMYSVHCTVYSEQCILYIV